MPSRSPVIFWLLVAATASVDAVVVTWIASEPYPASVYVMMTFHALLLSQLSLVCIWSAVQVNRSTWIWSIPLLATVLAATVTALCRDKPGTFIDALLSNLAYFGLHATLLLAALWGLQRTNLWRRRTGISQAWHYSILQLLVATTIVAILAAALRHSPFLSDDSWLNVIFAGSSVAITLASVVVWTSPRQWALRLATVLGIAMLLSVGFFAGAVFELDDRLPMIVSKAVGAHYLIQAIILSVWLGCGPILPPAQAFAPVDD